MSEHSTSFDVEICTEGYPIRASVLERGEDTMIVKKYPYDLTCSWHVGGMAASESGTISFPKKPASMSFDRFDIDSLSFFLGLGFMYFHSKM